MSSFNVSEYITCITCILINNENMSSGKCLTLFDRSERVTVVASLPINPSRDVTTNIPINGVKTTRLIGKR